MVFSQLSSHEKDAFFGLLDEYFTSRPDLLTNIAKSQAVNSAATSARDALKNPATRNAAMDTVKSALNSPRTNWNAKREPAGSPDPADETSQSGPGRVAAVTASLMSRPMFGGPPTSTSTGPPKPPPRKVSTNSTADDSNSPPPPTHKPPGRNSIGALTSARTFGSDVDLSSAKGFFTSVRGPSKNSNQPLANPSSLLPPSSSGTGTHKKQFAPPPVRRVNSDSSPTSTPPPPPPPPPRRKEEPDGEWAEVLYDYTGEEDGDLDVKVSQRVKIAEKSSEDWWTAELDGRKGFVPASYLKVV